MPVEVLVVAESAADARIVTGLCERVVVESDRRLDGPDLFGWENQSRCRYRGLEAGTEFAQWSRVPEIFSTQRRRIRAFAWGKGKGRADYSAARKVIALIVLGEGNSRPDFVLFSRDTDNEKERLESLRGIKTEFSEQFEILLAVQHPKMEAWLLNGFVPEGPDEEKRLAEPRRTLGFDPTIQAEKLTAQGGKGKRNAKKVLSALTDDEPERRARCWEETDLETLLERGGKTGLAEYLGQIDSDLVPRIRSSGQ